MHYIKAVRAANTERIQVNIPKDVQIYMGWIVGDRFEVTENKAKDQIILTRVKEKKQ